MAGHTVRVCAVSDLVPGEGLRVTSVSPPVAVFLTDEGEIHALDDTCTHQEASLSDGWIEDCAVECPLHASRFDLMTGHVDAPPAKLPVRVHVVRVDGDDVLLTLSDAEPNLPPGVRFEPSR